VLAPNKAADGRAQAAVETVHATLSGDTAATALGVTGRGGAPVLDLCRKLVAAGHDPRLPLHAYRGDVLCLCVCSIGEAATLRVGRIGFLRDRDPIAAP